MKKLFNPVNLCLLAIVAALVYGYRPAESTPNVEIHNASGEIQLVNSKDGAAIFQASNLAPGRNVTGTVQLSNTGSSAGALDLSQEDLVDNPGPGLGALSNALQLSVRDVTNPASPVTVFSGPPSALSSKSLGTLAPGQVRSYSFTATLPAASTNSLAGSGASMRYVWTLTGDGSNGGGGGGGVGGGSGGGATTPPATGGGTAGVGGGVAVSRMPVSVKVSARKIKKGLLAVTVKCGEPCAFTATAAAKGKPAVKTRRKSGRVKAAGKKTTIKLKLSKAARKALAKRTRKKALKLTVTVKARDPRGAWKTVKKTVKIKRAKKR